MQITVLSCWYPYPADNGAKLRILALLRALSQTYAVDLIVLDAAHVNDCTHEPIADICRSVVIVPTRPYDPRSLRAKLAYFRAVPRSVAASYNPAITALLKRRIAMKRCDAVLCECLGDPHTAQYGLDVAEQVPVVIDDLETIRFADVPQDETLRRRSARALTFWKFRRFVSNLSAKGAGYFATSQDEADHLYALTQRADWSVVVPNGVSIAATLPRQMMTDPFRLVYNGAPTYAPNRDAVAFFAAEILPLIRVEQPDVWLAVTGSTAGVALDEFARRPDIVFTDWQPDIRSYVSESKVCVVPLRQGGGTRLKILEAMALGTPVVATTKGAEGLDVTPDEDILIADHPAAFADAVLRLLTDPELYARIAARARVTVATRYDWAAIGEKMLDAFEDFVKGAQRDTRLIPPGRQHDVSTTGRIHF